MICTVLLPTRKRPARLRECIDSLVRHGSPERFDIRLAVDTDDIETQDCLPDLMKDYPNVKAMISDRGRGVHDLYLKFTSLADSSSAPWVWTMGDDVTISGSNWTDTLDQFPTDGVLLQPEIHQLGHSIYRNDPGGGFPMVPNQFWKKFGYEKLGKDGEAGDTFVARIYREIGWEMKFMPGVHVSHQRIADDTLAFI